MGLNPSLPNQLVNTLQHKTSAYQIEIIKKNGSNPTCRLCKQKIESTDHLLSGCLILTPIEIKERQDKIGNYIHRKVCKYYGVLDFEKWYKQKQNELLFFGTWPSKLIEK